MAARVGGDDDYEEDRGGGDGEDGGGFDDSLTLRVDDPSKESTRARPLRVEVSAMKMLRMYETAWELGDG